MDFNSFELLEEVIMADNQFYKEEDGTKCTGETRPRSLSLSITKPDWSAMLNNGEKSMKITDQLLDTPEILSQSLDWQLHGNRHGTDAFSSYYVPETVDEKVQITAIKKELQQDYEPIASPDSTVAKQSPYYETSYVCDGSNNLDEGSSSPSYSEAPSSMIADDEADDDCWLPSSNRRRPGRPKSTNSTTRSKPKEKRKLSDVDKNSEEYKAKRKRNNVAVRKSRDKAKRHNVEVQEQNIELERQNHELKKQNESLVREVSVLRKLITDIGRKVPDRLNPELSQYST